MRALPILSGLTLLLCAWPVAAAPVSATPAPAPAPAAAWFGPPTLCHPIAIGDGKSLPWKSGSFGRDPDYDLARVVADTLALLDGSDATFVHMETLRRAVIYLGDRGGEPGKAAAKDTAWRRAECQRLVGALASRTTPSDAAALRWFDLGYARAALDQMGMPIEAPTAPAAPATAEPGAAAVPPAKMVLGGGPNCRAPTAAELIRGPLDKAAALAPKDGALQLGIAIALFDGAARDEQACLEHLDRALALADDPKSLLRTNLLGTMGKFLGAASHDDLVAAVQQRRQRG